MIEMFACSLISGLLSVGAPCHNPERDLSVQEIFAAAVEAGGGQEAVEKVRTLRAIAEVESRAEGPKQFTIDASSSRQGGRRMTMRAGAQVAEFGTDGKLAWNKGTQAISLLTREQFDRMNILAVIMMNAVDPASEYSKATLIEVGEPQTIADRECRTVNYGFRDGRRGTALFDRVSGLCVGIETVESNGPPGGRTRMMFSDWRPEGGVSFFRRIEVTAPDGSVGGIMTITKVEINTLTEDAFSAPEDARRLAESTATSRPHDRLGVIVIRLQDLTAAQQEGALKVLDALRNNGDKVKMREAVERLESMIGMIKEDDKRLPIEYALQEAKRELAEPEE